MDHQITFRTASCDNDIKQILDLQSENLKSKVPLDLQSVHGFVTVRHDAATLHEMNIVSPHIVGIYLNSVIAYALGMDPQLKGRIAQLGAMFEIFDTITHKGIPISSYYYLVMGQICIHEKFRGKGIFRQLYETYIANYTGKYQLIVTEISVRNLKSLAAHKSFGFIEVHNYVEANVDEWIVVVYEL